MTWIQDAGFRVHHYPAIVTDDEGERASIWPEKWPLKFLESIEHTRDYAKNYASSPLGVGGDYWTLEDFHRGELQGVTRTLLSIDPAVTTKASSDFTGLAVVEWSPSGDACRVKTAVRVRLSGADLRRKVLAMLGADPSIGLILIETNQGGDVWKQILHTMPVNVKTIHQTVKKEVRAAATLNEYQVGRVVHAFGLTDLETEQVGFPRAPHDDLVDAVGTGVAYFLRKKARSGSGPVARQLVYV